jgi:hypothetical protein
VHQAEEVLLVEVFQVRIVVLQREVFGDLPVSTAVEELVAVLSSARDRPVEFEEARPDACSS